MLKLEIKLDENKILADQKYKVESIYQALEQAFAKYNAFKCFVSLLVIMPHSVSSYNGTTHLLLQNPLHFHRHHYYTISTLSHNP